jgi:glycosyltransferase involved in cell wall biosynthesis
MGDAGIIFTEGDPTALAKVLKELIIDPDLRNNFGKAGRKRVLQNFTWKSVAKRLCGIYAEIQN